MQNTDAFSSTKFRTIFRNTVYDNGVAVHLKYFVDIDRQFDFVMLHHAFEHMPEPHSVFRELFRILKNGSHLQIRIPVVASIAWRKYGVHWVLLDAPRHLFLHTIQSFSLLAGRAGFRLVKTVFDSKESQFWGSEQYLNDIAHTDPRSYRENPEKSIFTREQIESYGLKEKELNEKNDGDFVCFYLYKP